MRLGGSVGSHELSQDVHLAKVCGCCTAGDETAGARNNGVKRSQAFERLPLIVAITSPSSVRNPVRGGMEKLHVNFREVACKLHILALVNEKCIPRENVFMENLHVNFIPYSRTRKLEVENFE